MKVPSNARIDSALREQIERAGASSKTVHAVVTLKPEQPSEHSLSIEKVQSVTKALLERVRNRAGEKEEDFAILENLGAFNLVASTGFLVEVLKQPEVEGAFSAKDDTPAAIPPLDVKEAILEPLKTGRYRVH